MVTNKQTTDQPSEPRANLLLISEIFFKIVSLAIHAVQGGAIAIQIVARLSCCLTDHSRTGVCVE